VGIRFVSMPAVGTTHTLKLAPASGRRRPKGHHRRVPALPWLSSTARIASGSTSSTIASASGNGEHVS
jgi:hypothetical protein